VKLWWLADNRRLAAELAAVDGTIKEGWFRLSRWYLREGRLAAEGVITAHGAEYPVRLLYPDQFPSVPAWAEPQDPEVRWSEHQYGKGGALCLELRPDNWHPSASGGDVLRSAYNLLRTENPHGIGAHEPVTSAHHVGAIQAYDLGANPVLIGQGCLQRILDSTATDLRAIRWSSADDVWPILVYDAVDATSDGRPPAPDFWARRQDLNVCLAQVALRESEPSSRRELGEWLGLNLDTENESDSLLALAVSNSDVIPYHSTDADSVFRRKLVVVADEAGARSGHVGIGTKHLVVVGLGSVGSKIAESLLRSGAINLVLIDGDVMLPGNLERHTLDWRDVGFRKVNGVRRRLLNIRPGADIFTVAENLDWQRSASRHAALLDVLASSDLIVDVTGEVPTSLFLGAIAAENKKPFISVEVFEGGLGCVIARSVPGRDGTYAEGRAGLLSFCEQQAMEPPTSGTRPYEAFTQEGAIVVADDAAVSVAAGHAARVAIDVLEDAVDESSPAWLLLGLRRGWLFNGHGHTIGLHVPIAPLASSTQGNLPDSEEGETAREFAISMLREATDETAPPE